MGSVKEYFQSLGTGIASLVKGMQVTGKEFFTPKITEKYPENRSTHMWPERFRACLELIYDKDGNHRCIACGTCERNCPNGTIIVETKMVETPDGKKKKKLANYIYDLGSCTFCQLCVTTCPTNALEFSNNFEQSVFTRSKLVKKLNYLPEKPEPELTEEQKAALAAEKEAKIAEAKAKAAALKAEREAAQSAAPAAAPAADDDKIAKALAAAKGDPEKEAKIRAALAAKAAREAAKAAESAEKPAEGAEKAEKAAEVDDKIAKALAAAKGDPEKEAKIRAALAAKAAREAAKAAENAENQSDNK